MMTFYIDKAHVAGVSEARPLFPNPCRSSKGSEKMPAPGSGDEHIAL